MKAATGQSVREQIDPRYYNTPYYVAPRDQVGQEAFAVIRDAMAEKGLVGMGRVVLANRERPIILEPMGIGLLAITLRYAHEVRNETEYFSDVPQMTLPDKMLKITEHILETKKEDFDPARLTLPTPLWRAMERGNWSKCGGV
jgi:Ku protein